MHIMSAMTVIRRRMTFGPLLLSSSLLASCGGGGSSSGAPSPVATPPSDLQYPAAPAFVVDTAIAELTPTVVGEVTSYSVSPALPARLSLNTTTGVISGTPISVAAKADYTVKATNAAGSTTAVVSIVVVTATTGAPSNLKYPTGPAFFVNTYIDLRQAGSRQIGRRLCRSGSRYQQSTGCIADLSDALKPSSKI